MFRIALAAILLVPAAMAEQNYPCTTASSGSTTYAYCPYSGTCYTVNGGAVTDISTLNEDECLAQANGPVDDDDFTAVEETVDADRSVWAEVYVDDELTDETLIEEAAPVRTQEAVRF